MVKFGQIKTERGFSLIDFKDFYDIECSIQLSNILEPKAIWLGVNEANPLMQVLGEGWKPVPFPVGTMFHTRMHLTQKQVKALIPILQASWIPGN
jgi:hypothetical protein